MFNINWKIRFTKDNGAFLMRVAIAIAIPVLTYFGLEAKDLTSWGIVWDTLVQAFQTPYVWIFTLVNVFNLLPDPTTKGLGDSQRAMNYVAPTPKGGK